MKTKYSPILKQKISYDEDKKILTCEDGAVYNQTELKLLHDIPDEKKYITHQVKHFFQGEIIS